MSPRQPSLAPPTAPGNLDQSRTRKRMEEPPEKTPKKSWRPERTDKLPTNNHTYNQEDEEQDQEGTEADNLIDHGTGSQAKPKINVPTERKVPEDTWGRTYDQTEVGAYSHAAANQRKSDQTQQRDEVSYEEMEQTNRKTSIQGEIISEQPEKLSRQTEKEDEQNELSSFVQNDQRETEQSEDKMTHQAGQTSEQMGSGLSGLLEPKTPGQKFYDQINQGLSGKTNSQMPELSAFQSADQPFSSADFMTMDKLNYDASAAKDYQKEAWENLQYQFDAGTSDWFESRSNNRFQNIELDKIFDSPTLPIESCTFETSKTNLPGHKVSDFNESDAESVSDTEGFNTFETRLSSNFQTNDQNLPNLFPSIPSKSNYLHSEGRNEANSDDKITSQQKPTPRNYSHSSRRLLPPIVHQDPYQVALLYMEKHHILQVFQQITENLVYERPEDPLRFMLSQIQQMIRKRDS
ncbi:testis-specific expressed protein 55 [Erinaceus europaeus]|uniref:Testis-specific expressed protein 55 n=1 Tax=Erinaceus europaeus TaxID=9365 RepID=A0ABM3XW95_ERIEU|nr:testis-specific expressed protein 55 [Erinaceus europaeus]